MRLLSSLALLLLVGCAGAPEPRPAALPAFVVDALQAPTARKAKLYVAADGTVSKAVAYVERAAIPDWVHTMADEQLGAGEDTEYEVEQYADGTQTYEVTRTVNGLKAELSVTADRKLNYTERALADDAVPEPIKAAVAGLDGMQVARIEHKKGPSIDQFEVVARKGEAEMRLVFAPDGKPVSTARRLPAVVQIEGR